MSRCGSQSRFLNVQSVAYKEEVNEVFYMAQQKEKENGWDKWILNLPHSFSEKQSYWYLPSKLSWQMKMDFIRQKTLILCQEKLHNNRLSRCKLIYSQLYEKMKGFEIDTAFIYRESPQINYWLLWVFQIFFVFELTSYISYQVKLWNLFLSLTMQISCI